MKDHKLNIQPEENGYTVPNPQNNANAPIPANAQISEAKYTSEGANSFPIPENAKLLTGEFVADG